MKYIALLITNILFCQLVWGQTKPTGEGTSGSPYQVTTLEHLKWISIGDGGDDEATRWSAHYEMTQSIDASSWSDGEGFSPIGYKNQEFTGSFNGKGFVIYGLYINRPEKDYTAMFGYTLNASVKNIGLINVAITGKWAVGGLVAKNENTDIQKSFVTGSVTGTNKVVGGLIGLNTGTSYVNKVYSTAKVTGTSNVGGLVGSISGTTSLVQAYASGQVESAGTVGGAIGKVADTPTIDRVYWNKETTQQTSSGGSEDTFGLTSDKFTSQDNFVSWDFSNTWVMNTGFTHTLSTPITLKKIPIVELILETNEVGEGNSTLTGAGEYFAGETIQISATPNEGYEYKRWKNANGSEYSTTNPLDLTLANNMYLKATFQLITYDITVSKTGNGTISPNGTVSVNHGENQTFTITADDGYQVSNIMVDGESQAIADSYTFENVKANHNIDITFAMQTSTTWNGATWDNGAPSSLDDAVVSSSYTGNGFDCQNLTINAGQTVEIGHGTLDIKGDLTNNGTLLIKSGASLLTYEGTTFSGNDITIERNTRYANGQYSFVGSVVKENASIKGKTLGKAIYKYDETVDYGLDEGLKRWVKASKDQLVAGRGYTQAYKQKLSFVGEPNNGTIVYTGTYTDRSSASTDGWNLIANPYPTGIKTEAFTAQNGNITGAVYLWDDNGSNVERGSNDDYIIINGLGVTDSKRGSSARLLANGGGYILGASQGFFVRISDKNQSKNITFTEDMRVGGMNADANFFRKAETTKQTFKIALESNDNELFAGTLLGFVEDATEGVDRSYDAEILSAKDLQIYSLIEGKHFAIQGLPLLSGERIIPLGMDIAEAGTYKLSIYDLQNLPEGTEIELIDTQLSIVHNLSKDGIYTFDTEEAVEDNRFVLNVKDNREVISSLDNLAQNISIKASINGLQLFGSNSYQVSIMDISGSILLNKNLKNTAQLPYTFEKNKLYIVKVNSEVKKVIF